jgi:xanthine dehydrogenase accessory factor
MRTGNAVFARFTLTEEMAGAEGLNCGGTVQILVEPVGGAQTLQVHRAALEALERQQETALATLVADPLAESREQGPRTVEILGKGLVGWTGVREGSGWLGASPPASLLAPVVEAARALLGTDRAALSWVTDPVTGQRLALFVESVTAQPVLYLFGGGHVGQAVASVARTAGFRIVVIDDRQEFSSPERFPFAERTLVRPMENALEDLPIDRGAYIVAVTRGHQHDERVIEQAIATPARYIGMIGSRRKKAILWRRLKARGARDADLDRVHSPIGLAIGADSPGEIAVSVVAEMIRVRRGYS